MAISKTHYELLCSLYARGELPQGGHILEIGQANFYGDMDPRHIAPELAETRDLFEIAAAIYRQLFAPASVTAIDASGPTALKFDLNQPVRLPRQFDVSINHGTAEHVFNIAQVFATMHQWTRPGGLMIHESPFTGWVDHGFYCLQPTLFYDVAAANGYAIVGAWLEHLASQTSIAVESREHIHDLARRDQLPGNAMLFVSLRKGSQERPFAVPMQGVYSAGASETTRAAWMELR